MAKSLTRESRPPSLLPVSLSAARPASAQAAPQLTALDYFEIQQLVAKYARAIDTCSNNGYDYADLFAEDGYFAPDSERQGRHEGTRSRAAR